MPQRLLPCAGVRPRRLAVVTGAVVWVEGAPLPEPTTLATPEGAEEQPLISERDAKEVVVSRAPAETGLGDVGVAAAKAGHPPLRGVAAAIPRPVPVHVPIRYFKL